MQANFGSEVVKYEFSLLLIAGGVSLRSFFISAARMVVARGIFHYTTVAVICQAKMLHKN